MMFASEDQYDSLFFDPTHGARTGRVPIGEVQELGRKAYGEAHAGIPPIPGSPLTPVWAVELPAALAPVEVLAGSHGVVVCGKRRGARLEAGSKNEGELSECRIFTRSGEAGPIVKRRVDAGVLDRSGRRLVVSSPDRQSSKGIEHPTSAIGILRLNDLGVERWVSKDSHEALVGLYRWGSMYLFLTEEIEVRQPHERRQIPTVSARLRHIPRAGMSAPGELLGLLMTDERHRILAHPFREGVVFAMREGIEWRDWSFSCGASWRSRSVVPSWVVQRPEWRTDDRVLLRSVSGLGVRKDGTTFLLADLGFQEGRMIRMLYVVSPRGETLASREIGYSPTVAPIPLVTDDGVAVLTLNEHVMAVDAAANLLWQHRRSGSLGGTATSGDGVLTGDDRALSWWSIDGTRRVLWRAPGPIRTPVAYADGAWFVATETILYCLRARGGRR